MFNLRGIFIRRQEGCIVLEQTRIGGRS